MGANGFTSPLKEGLLWTFFFIALKIHHPWPGLNLYTLGRMACTLAITPPRMMNQTQKTQTLFYLLHSESDYCFKNCIKEYHQKHYL
jgi:hypothetical protein